MIDIYQVGKLDNSEVFQLNFNVINRFDDRLFIEFCMKDETGRFTDEENFKRIHINMVKPLEKYYNNGKESLTKLEKILVMFQITSRRELKDISKGDEDLESMAKIIEDLNEDEHIIGLYDKDKMDAWMKKIDHAEAVKEGHAEGAQSKTIEIAKNMLQMNMEIPTISKATGLTELEIKKIKENKA